MKEYIELNMFHAVEVYYTQEWGTPPVHRNSNNNTSRWMMMFVTRACHKCAYAKMIYLGQHVRVLLLLFLYCNSNQAYMPAAISPDNYRSIGIYLRAYFD